MRRDHRRAQAHAACAGVLLGALASLVNGATAAALAPVSLVLGIGWPWVALAAGAGAWARRPAAAAVAGAVAPAAAVAAYYAVDLARGVYATAGPAAAPGSTGTDWPGLASDLLTWVPIAVAGGALLGLVGARARGPGAAGLLCRLAVPAAVLAEVLWRLAGETGPQARPAAVATWAVTGVLAATALLVLPVRHARATRAGAPQSRKSPSSCTTSPSASSRPP